MGATSLRFPTAGRFLAGLLIAFSAPAIRAADEAAPVAGETPVVEEATPAAEPAPVPAPASAPESVPPPAPAAAPAAAPAPAVEAPAPKAQAPSPEPESIETTAEGEGPGDLVIEVDESQSRNEGKSLPLAMFCSALLPGAGEYYLEEKDRARTFLLVEAGFWASLYVAWMAKGSYLQSARSHAAEYAGIDAGNKSEKFLETMAVYRSYQEKQHRQDSYELSQVLSGKREQDYDIKPEPGNYWDFGSSANPENTRNWRSYQSTLRYYRASKVAMSFALGALALNRLGSLMNTLQTYKRTSARTSARGRDWELAPDFGPDYAGTRLTVRF